MSVIAEVAAEASRFTIGCGFKPDRVVLTPDQLREALTSCYPYGGDRIFGMKIELGDRLQCRAKALAA